MSEQPPFSFADEDPAPRKRSAPPPAEPAPPAASAAPAAPPPVPEADADIKPGSRKDLWNCPHCGAGNRPERGTCRGCGKSPADAVVVPWLRRPLALAGLAAAAVLLVVGLVVALRNDLTLREPAPEHADRALRRGGSPRQPGVDLAAGRSFVPEDRCAVTGRLLLGKSVPLGHLVVLALGGDARDDAVFAAMSATHSAAGLDVAGGTHVALILIRPAQRPETRGQWLSVAGDAGSILNAGTLEPENGWAVAVRADEVKP